MFLNYPAQFWAPFRVTAVGAERVLPVARLKAGINMRLAQNEMNRLAGRLSDAYPATNKGWGIRLEPALDVYVGWVRQPLFIAQGVALVVLLIACGNAAGLLLVRATVRVREIGLRIALGGGPWQISRQLLSECALLSGFATLLGVGVAYAGLKLFPLISPAWFPRVAEIGLHVRVLAATAATSVVTTLTFGMIPAWQASRLNLVCAIGEMRRGVTSGTRLQKLRQALAVLQISAALTLLTGAGLMINSFVRLYSSSPGCDTRNLITFQLRITAGRLLLLPAEVLFERIRERIAGIPGVTSVAFASHAPFSESPPPLLPFSIEGRQGADGKKQAAMRLAVSSDYFRTLKTPLIRGREFRPEDIARNIRVALINEAVARRFWPSESPVGNRITLGGANEPDFEIIGVAGDLRHDRRAQEAEMQIYLPSTPVLRRSAIGAGHDRIFLVRGAEDATRLIPFVRAAVAAEDRAIPIFNIKTVDTYIAQQLWQPRQTMILLCVFSAAALLLAMSGVFGIISYMVSQRTQEIGIRVALGATNLDVVMLVMKQGAALVALGIAGGIFGSYALAVLLKALLWQVPGTDTASYGASVALLIATAVLACYLPARQALRVDAFTALRAE